MLGKRPRPLQRTMSKMQLTPDDVSLGLPAIEPLQEKPIQISPNSGLPRQIIGFNPVSSDHFETVSSPRSVLSGAGSGCSQVKSPRSPRSGLGSLLYGAGFREDKGFESVGLGIVATLNNAIAEENRCRNRAMELPNIAKEVLSSPKQSEPIPIEISSSGCDTPSWKKTIQSEIMSSCNDSLQINSPAWSCRGLQACSNETSAFGALSDAEMEICDSIFSTASPVSSCSETWSVSVLEINFLNACYFCKRHIGPGKDIYMYRGDKAFCSTECRYQQIMLDERKERCSASVPSTTVKHHGRLLTTTTPAAA